MPALFNPPQFPPGPEKQNGTLARLRAAERVLRSVSAEELMFPLDWQRNLIADGRFTVESDRAVVVKLGEAALASGLAEG